MVFKIDRPETKFKAITSKSPFAKSNYPEDHCGTLDNYFQFISKYLATPYAVRYFTF